MTNLLQNSGTMERPFEQTQERSMALYGDLMTGLTYTLFLPMYLRSHHRDAPGLRGTVVVASLFSGCTLNWAAWARNTRRLSLLAFVMQVACFTTNTIFQWPFGKESMLVPQFLWSVIVHTSSNLSLEAPVKVVMIVYALFWALVSTILSDNLDKASTVAICIASAIFTAGFHTGMRAESRPNKWKDELRSARLAEIVLGAVYAYHLASEIMLITRTPGYAMTGGLNIVKNGFVASMGIVATGAFQNQVSIKRSLLRLVERKGYEIAHQAEIMQMISLALEASETAIAITDADHTILWSNQALRKLVGDVECDGAKLCDVMKLSGESLKIFQSCFSTICQTLELKMNGKETKLAVSPFTLSLTDPQSAANGEGDVRYLVSISDISQLRARERAEKAAEQAAVQRTAMQESMETLTHELRTPLQGIIGMTSLVYDNNQQVSAGEMHQCLNTVMASSRLLLTLINNLLDSHKMDANMMDDFKLFPLPLAGAMKETANFCRPIAALNDTNPELCLEFDEDETILVRSNPVRFQQVLVNLVSNAIKYGATGTIKIRAEIVSVGEANDRIKRALERGRDPLEVSSSTSRVAIISVEDSGEGIPQELKGRVFQKFSQYNSLERSPSGEGTCMNFVTGTGIGLNLCRRFVDRMGGAIWVTNKLDGGACFSFCLPVLESSTIVTAIPGDGVILSTPAEAIAACDLPQQPPTLMQDSLSILVVDDTLINLKVLERMTKRISKDFRVTTADSGAKALQEVNERHFDLVITDLQMPNLDGFALSQAIQQSATISPKPIIVALTAETSESLYHRCSAVGIVHILYKPISSQQLQSFFEKTLPSLLARGGLLPDEVAESQDADNATEAQFA